MSAQDPGSLVRVLIADDSAPERDLLLRILSHDPGIEVVATAPDGAHAVRLAAKLRPDVVAMDLHMPVLDGISAARRIMQEAARPIVLLSPRDEALDPRASARALEAGALMVVAKPERSSDEEARALASTIRLMADVKVVTRRRPPERSREAAAHGSRRRDIVAIAASTGGPAALATVLGGLPPTLPVPVVVVQHITSGFDRGLVTWLDRISRTRVRLATDGMPLAPGEVAVAPNDVHLGVTARGTAALGHDEPIGGHRPSATHLFRSVARAYRSRALAVILTGMGSDGVAGLLEVERLGGCVIAQDQSSSVVYGMPRGAVALGAADRVLHLCDIAGAVMKELAHDRALA